MDAFKRLIGHSIAAGLRAMNKCIRSRSIQRVAAQETTAELDRTGLCVTEAAELQIAWRDSQVIYPVYESSVAHSFWRAQEFSLFMQHQHLLESPTVDFGCGDGSFSAVLFKTIDYGVDIDEQALGLAREFGIYRNLIHSRTESVPLADSSIASVFSNSVLEHVNGIDTIFGEIARLLRPGGVFVFTVPVLQFARDLTYWFGEEESRTLNEAYYHRNLQESADWVALLEKHGFQVQLVRPYQPREFTYSYWMYRLCGPRGLGRLIPNLGRRLWQRRRPWMVEQVRHSISGNIEAGGNCLFVAIRGAARRTDQ